LERLLTSRIILFSQKLQKRNMNGVGSKQDLFNDGIRAGP